MSLLKGKRSLKSFADGYNYQEIADKIFISVDTVVTI